MYYLQIDKRLSKNTIKSYKTDLDMYEEFLIKYQNCLEVCDITTKSITNYIQSLKKKNLSKTTIARKITVIKEFHKFLVREKILNNNVSLPIDSPKIGKKLPEVLTSEEINLMIDSIKTDSLVGIRNKAMLEVLYSTGLRISELLNLRISDIHMNSKFIQVTGKGNKERIVPISNNAIKALRVYIENARLKLSNKPGDLLFYNYKGDQLSRQGFFKILKELAIECNISKEISPHTIRHTFATTLLEGNVDLRMVQEMLGHEDISTTQIYTHIDKQKLRKTYLAAHPLANKDEKK